MWDHGYNISIFGALMFLILQGVSIVLTDQKVETLLKATGSSLDIHAQYPKGNIWLAEWRFKGEIFAEFSSSRNYSFPESRFSGRLKEDHNKVGVTILQLQPQDSGTFSVVADGTEGQAPTYSFNIYTETPITAVQVKKNQMWKVSTNSCDVDVKCAALGAENVSYLWSGYKTASGAQLQFSLSPAEGAVTLNCTATNNVSSSSASETLSCSTKQAETDVAILKSAWIIAVAGAVAVLLVIFVIVAVSCWWKSHKDGSVPEGTVYADVNSEAVTQKNRQSDSVVNGMTVYETVDDLRKTPDMTIYAKVTLPHTSDNSQPFSPYQQVL